MTACGTDVSFLVADGGPALLAAAAGDENHALVSFAWIMAAALAAPILSFVTGKRIPSVVFLLALGALIGPFGTGLADQEPSVGMVKELGLGMLFLLAGYEIRPESLRGAEGRHALATWLICAVLSFLGFLAVFSLTGVSGSSTAVVLAIAVTSTALGTLMPILRQQGLTGTTLGESVMVHGAVGEVAPIIAMALLLSARATWLSAAVLLAFFAVAVTVAFVPRTVRFLAPWATRAMADGAGSTDQTVVRAVILMLGVLMAVAAVLDLDVVLGAFATGMILGQLIPAEYRTALEGRLDVVGYGLLIPVFFVASGMDIDTGVVVERPWFLVVLVPLIFCTRGVPVILRERFCATGSGLTGWRPQVQLGLYVATGLPIIVAVTDVAVRAGFLGADDASLLVAGGAMTVLLFPLLAATLQPRGARRL